MGTGRSSWRVVIFIAVFAAALAPSGARATTVVNGGFESGTLNGWHVHLATEAGNWFAYKGVAAPIGSKRGADPVQAPPEGSFAATSDEANPDTLILYQDVTLDPGRSQRLSLLAYYDSYEPIAVPIPDTLSVDDEVLAGQASQQYRIDVMKPDAPLESLDPADILRTVFETRPGDPQSLPPTRFSADLSAFAGQTVRIRIANAAHEEVLNAGVDAVSISDAAPGQSGPRGSKQGPALFRFGKLRANPRSGIVTLRVRVSGPGLLRAKGVSGAGRASGIGALRKPIEPITVPVAAAKTVTVHLQPTPSARRVLQKRHKLRVRVGVTYMPTGGSPEAASLPVTFKLAAHSVRR